MNDAIPLNFNPAGLVALNAIIALMVLGASLDLRPADLRNVFAKPAGVIAGLSAQAFFTPAATCLLTWVFRVDPALFRPADSCTIGFRPKRLIVSWQ